MGILREINCILFRKIARIFFGCYYSLMFSMNVFQFCWSFYLVMLVSPKVRWNHLVILILSMDENFQTLKDWSIWKPKNEKIENNGPVEDIFFFNCNWLNTLCNKGLTCLRCSDITEPRLCTKIERCQDGEVIFWKFIPIQEKKNNHTVIQRYVYLCSHLNRCVQCSSTGRTMGTLDTGQAAIPDRCVN